MVRSSRIPRNNSGRAGVGRLSGQATPLTPMQKGDVLFTIDPRPYQAEVDRLRADQSLKIDADTAGEISDYRHIIAFRNIPIHGYAEIDHRLVWVSWNRKSRF